MSSSIALGCNGYEAHMQQILTLYGVYVVIGDHGFCLQKPPESSKTERKTQNHLSICECFWKCLAVSEEIIGIHEAVTVMKEKSFTHIPILEDGYVKGVFSENTIFSSIIRDKIIEIDESTKFSEYEEFLPPEKHQTETIVFEPNNMMKTELDIVFAKARKNQERIGMVLVTQNGKPNERLLGIITAWDFPEG